MYVFNVILFDSYCGGVVQFMTSRIIGLLV